jgi:RimJ/RimL family protein N-acetyltransferase
MPTQLSEPHNGRPGVVATSARAADAAEYPSISTRRFTLRAFALADIESLVALARKHRIADTTIGVPQPLTADSARLWICSHAAAWRERRALHWAAIHRAEQAIAGYAGLNPLDLQSRQAQLRFWVGRGVERKRDAVEWAEAIVRYALQPLGITRIYALQLERYPLAGHVLAAVGMQPEGPARQRMIRGGLVEDIVCWSLPKRNA